MSFDAQADRMDPRGDERGQAAQIGAIMLFATLIVLASVYQAYVVPQETNSIEFDDYREASADVIDARNALLATASENAQHGQTVKTGSTYPSRVLFVNPPPASGRVVTTPNQSVSLTNVESVSENPNVDRYFASTGRNLTFQTRHLEFLSDYNRFTAADLVLTQGVVYRNYSNPVPLTTQTLVQGNRINLVTVAGDLEAGGLTAGLTFEPLSAHTRTVTVTGADNETFTLTVPTDLPASVWEDRLLAGQIDEPGDGTAEPDAYVRDVTDVPGGDAVNVTFEANETYELRLSRVLVHSESDDPTEHSPRARYVVADGETDVSTDSTGRVKLTVETRDRFNNPVSSANVTFQSNSGDFETRAGGSVTDLAPNNPGITVKTNENGRGVVYFNATGHLGDIPVDAYLGNDTSATGERRLNYTVFNSVFQGGGGGSGEQAGRALVVLSNYDESTIDGNSNTLVLDINNSGSFPVNMTGYRLDYVTAIRSNGEFVEGPEYIDEVQLDSLPPRTQNAYEAQSPAFLSGTDVYNISTGQHTLTFTFDQSYGGGNNIQGVMVGVAIYLEGGITVRFTIHALAN